MAKSFELYLMKDTALLGCVTFEPLKGYRFIPNMAGRYTSRKWHPTYSAAIPTWADKIATDLLDGDDFKARVGKTAA